MLSSTNTKLCPKLQRVQGPSGLSKLGLWPGAEEELRRSGERPRTGNLCSPLEHSGAGKRTAVLYYFPEVALDGKTKLHVARSPPACRTLTYLQVQQQGKPVHVKGAAPCLFVKTKQNKPKPKQPSQSCVWAGLPQVPLLALFKDPTPNLQPEAKSCSSLLAGTRDT